MEAAKFKVAPRHNKRFDQRVLISPSTACWEWTGCTTKKGYGLIVIDGRRIHVHRYAFARFNGDIPDGLTIDHLCRNRRCVNPVHLEAVTSGTNVLRGNSPTAKNARKSHCANGHPLTPGNLCKIKKNPSRRMCKACRRHYYQKDRDRWNARKRERYLERKLIQRTKEVK